MFATLAAAYVAWTVLVLAPHSPVTALDLRVAGLHMQSKHPGWLWWVNIVVGFGQRWIMTIVIEVIVFFVALRARSLRPVVQLALAILLLNSTVAAVKYATGRSGPAHNHDAHKIFQLGDNIYPSGHVSNAVVIYGLLVLVMPQYRKLMVTCAVTISLAVSWCTLYLRTHWFSDVVGGWIAGMLILVAMPTLTPWAQRFADELVRWMTPVVTSRPRLFRLLSAGYGLLLKLVPADRRLQQAKADDGLVDPEFAGWPQSPAASSTSDRDYVSR